MKILKHASVCLLAFGLITLSATIVQAELVGFRKPNAFDLLKSRARQPIIRTDSLSDLIHAGVAENAADMGCSTFSLQNGAQAFTVLDQQMNEVGDFSSTRSCAEAMEPRSFVRMDRFTTQRCNSSYLCTQSKVKRIGDQEKQSKFYALVREIAAKDLAKNLIEKKSADMEELEILKKFAQKKYGASIGASCPSRFGAAGGVKCKLPVLESAFKENQTTCSQGFGCYNSDNQGKQKYSYKTFEENFDKNSNESPMITFFEGRVDWKTNKHLDQDQAYLEGLGMLVASPVYVRASAAEKEDMFIRHIKQEGSRSRYADPIISYDFDIDDNDIAKVKEKPQFKNLKAILHKKNISKKDFIAQFESFRKKRAESLLDSKAGECSSVPSISSICEEVTNLHAGVKNKFMSSLTLASVLDNRTMNKESEEFKKLNALLSNSISSIEEMEVFLDAERCTSFNYVDLNHKPGRSQTRIDLADNLGTGYSADENTDFYMWSTGGTVVNDRSTSSSSSSVNDPAAMNDTLTSLGLGKSNGMAIKEHDGFVSDSLATKPADQGMQQSYDAYGSNNNYFNQNPLANNQFNHKEPTDYLAGVDKDNKAVLPAETSPGAVDSSANNSKLDELMKKLSATEEKLDKLKATTDAAEESRAKEKKIQEENALIAELKGQITELKSKSAKASVAPVESQAAREVRASAPGPASSFAVASNRAAEAKPVHQENYDSQRSTAEAASSASSAGPTSASAASRAIASSQILTSVSDSGDSASNLTLTKMDGMTSEKAAETISSRILELNGVPFLIEEDGITKKIIPLIKDGKIDLDENGQPKYVKMKVNKKDCSEEEKARGACRVPASAVAKVNTTVADEKRDQEEKLKREIERAQYLKLKALTDKALNKK